MGGRDRRGTWAPAVHSLTHLQPTVLFQPLLSAICTFRTLPFIRQTGVSLLNVFTLIRVHRSGGNYGDDVFGKTLFKSTVCWFSLVFCTRIDAVCTRIDAVCGGKQRCISVGLTPRLSL